MEKCLLAEKDIDRFNAKLSTFRTDYENGLNTMIERAVEAKNRIVNDDVPMTDIHQMTSDITRNSRESVARLSKSHKDLHGICSKIGKTIDRNFNSGCSRVYLPEILRNEECHKLLNTAICEHLYRTGENLSADILMNEAELHNRINPHWHVDFSNMNRILGSLRNKNVDEALVWAEDNDNKVKLLKIKSQLEFKLHRLKFLCILEQGDQIQAIKYARKFSQYASDHTQQVQKLMGSLTYLKVGLKNSPYSQLLSESVWEDACTTFVKDACKIKGWSVSSPLLSGFQAGCQALPKFLDVRDVIESRMTSQCHQMLSRDDELPVDIELDDDQRYHSVFACPILKSQTTEENPPMKLKCGHVVSHDALKKLVQSHKVKCPYCPKEQGSQDGRRIYF